MLGRSLWIVFVLGLLLEGARPATQKPVPAKAINAAIDQGVAWLVAQQRLDGTWPYSGDQSRPGNNALAVYTLLKSGLPKNHAAIELGFEALRANPPKDTYGTAILLMAFAARHDPADLPWARKVAKELQRSQHGDFGYPSGADLSNTQYGALGLRATEQLGLDVSKSAWLALGKATLKYAPKESKGFTYSKGRRDKQVTGSMTSAGVGILSICIDALSDKPSTKGQRKTFAAARDRGLEWLGENFSVTRNPGGSWLGYYLYGLERVGGLAGVAYLGEHDWYAEGAAELVRKQRPSGAWRLGNSGTTTSTCFALLFLRRATGAAATGDSVAEAKSAARTFTSADPDAAVPLVASGRGSMAVWLGNWSRAVLDELEWPGESGRGPHVVRVTYFLDREKLAVVAGNAKRPAGTNRFPAKVELEESGSWRIRARIEIVPPPEVVDGVERPSALRLVTTEVQIDLVPQAPERGQLAEWQLDNARDAGLDLLKPGQASARTSSVAKPKDVAAELGLPAGLRFETHAALAVDGRVETSWLADPKDDAPELTLTLRKPVTANRIVLGNAHTQPLKAELLARAGRVEVTINGTLTREITMPPDERQKARIALPQPMRIKRLEIRILSRIPARSGYRAVGLSEVELQLVED